jgi:hypothetical protein
MRGAGERGSGRCGGEGAAATLRAAHACRLGGGAGGEEQDTTHEGAQRRNARWCEQTLHLARACANENGIPTRASQRTRQHTAPRAPAAAAACLRTDKWEVGPRGWRPKKFAFLFLLLAACCRGCAAARAGAAMAARTLRLRGAPPLAPPADGAEWRRALAHASQLPFCELELDLTGRHARTLRTRTQGHTRSRLCVRVRGARAGALLLTRLLSPFLNACCALPRPPAVAQRERRVCGCALRRAPSARLPVARRAAALPVRPGGAAARQGGRARRRHAGAPTHALGTAPLS